MQRFLWNRAGLPTRRFFGTVLPCSDDKCSVSIFRCKDPFGTVPQKTEMHQDVSKRDSDDTDPFRIFRWIFRPFSLIFWLPQRLICLSLGQLNELTHQSRCLIRFTLVAGV